ncbi:MAG: UDP-2,4-diacetamido-2,4,6-trideoxy-beta-L-altropyranose hydrolase [Polyangiaceae bacterium]|nr:UDP-2,4-diacetamido-2,4,6-trideoxy-beta-L-altropyranose hydrolase [Polyangiaceae bacterium]
MSARPSSLLLRADASAEAGTGHVMRMLALGQAWQARGGDVTLATCAPEALRARGSRMGARIVEVPAATEPAADRATLEAARGARAVALDGYAFGHELLAALRQAGARVLVVDDNGENERYASDLVLNQNLHARLAMYARRAPWTQALLGPRYTLLRSEFRGHVAPPRPAPGARSRVLVSMGGADPVDATGATLRALAELSVDERASLELRALTGAANPRVEALQALAVGGLAEVLAPTDDIAPHLAWADVALAAAGSTLWELCALGVPALLVPIADNQVELAREVARRGAAIALPDARTSADGRAWLAAAASLARDDARRLAISSAARALVDGEGAARVAAALDAA